MAYQSNIPQATDLISSSQSDILGNFQYLGDTTGNVANGYYKLPNGIIIQWGSIVMPKVGSASGQLAVSFNLAYSSAAEVFNIQFSPYAKSSAQVPKLCLDLVTPITSTGFQIRYSSNTLVDDGTIFWFSVGK